VRFFDTNGDPAYVTVDNQLPAGGNLYDQPVNGALWAALAEKAYVQLNEEGWLGTLSPGVNTYAALDNGNADTMATALQAFTGHPTTTLDSVPDDLGDAMSAGQLVVLGTPNAGSEPSPHVEHNHAYAVVGYNPGQEMPFVLFSPWGIQGGTDNGQQIYGQFIANLAAVQADFNDGAWLQAAPGGAATGPAGVGLPGNALDTQGTTHRAIIFGESERGGVGAPRAAAQPQAPGSREALESSGRSWWLVSHSHEQAGTSQAALDELFAGDRLSLEKRA
jgi:hypothetical protein